MSWKIYMIIICNANNINATEVPQKIGLTNLKVKKEITLHQAQYESGVSVGKYGDKLFIVSESLIFGCLDTIPSEFEKKICNAFPDSEIAILTLNGTVDLYGYSIIKNGKRLRVKMGADLTTYIDYGDKLPEEIAIAKEKIFDDEVLKEIKESSADELRAITEQEIGIRTTFRLTKRYFGKQFDEPGSDYEKIKVTLYE
jgi:hypothetical protein